MTTVVLRIAKISSAGAASRKTLAFAEVHGNEILIRSQLPNDAPLNEHLVWLWGRVNNERKYVKSLQSEGAVVTVEAKSRLPISIDSNGAELLHLLGARLEISGHDT